jgi:hypothetical protein
MWCLDCSFRVEDKSVIPNPFLDAADIQAAKRRPDPSPLGEALSRLAKAKRKPPAVDGEKPDRASDLPAEE